MSPLFVSLLVAGCIPYSEEGEPKDTEARDTEDPDVDPDDQAEDDERVRGLTGLREGDDACASPVLVRIDFTVDGDTFYASPDGGGAQLKVRIIGVDTPEVEHDDPAECYGNEAWTWAAARLEGNLAWLTFDAECEDQFDRTLAYVFRDTTEAGFFNRAIARAGMAEELTIEPNDTFRDEIRSDVRAARDEGLGLWGACAR